MISTIQIRNFSTHQKLDVKFSKGVTSIVGPSYAGKSTIVRALRWIALNRPAGTSFIRWGSNKTIARLGVDDSVIKRIRSKNNINSYRLDDKRFAAFGNDVPTSILSKLNLSPINFQGQHDAPFWFCETAGEVSRQLNNIVNLDAMDKSMSFIASEIRKADLEIGFIQKRLDDLKVQQKQLAFVPKMNDDLKECEGAQRELEKQQLKLAALSELLEGVKRYRNEANRLKAADVAINSVIVLGKSALDLTSQTTRLGELLENIEEKQETLNNRPPSMKPLEKMIQVQEESQKRYEVLDALIRDLGDQQNQIEILQTSVQKIQSKMNEISKGRCPLCGQQI